ncbi:uncharacterized protein LOC109845647 [Asparagus officinalis]|uniref:uncharacterized protein LOC109845647 n=1 Tax=Asparagus officinalis TaxID=4686 RepID=UPI00098E6508|nr:uncharacterized protein LOC109845647 [Asparagus officinalis]
MEVFHDLPILDSSILAAVIDTFPSKPLSSRSGEYKVQEIVVINEDNDSELGNNQKGETFWGKITQYVNENAKSGNFWGKITQYVNENAKSGKERIVSRTSRCHSHFKDINRKISSFIGCYSTACREKRSGWSDENYISKARELYFEKIGTTFNLVDEWKVVRNQPKYMTGGNASGSSGSKRKSSGLPGSLNDINVLDRSPVFDDIESGEAPRVNFTVNGREYNLAYYLADGIYPKWLVFVQSIQMPQGNKHQFFAKQQESCRKDVERAFGVLQARFAIVRQPARMWDLDVLGKIMRACIILHNMIVEDERDTYSRNWENIDFEPSNNASSSASFNVQTDVLPEFQVHVQHRSEADNQTRVELRDKTQHIQLKKDLIEHIWQKFGTTSD